MNCCFLTVKHTVNIPANKFYFYAVDPSVRSLRQKQYFGRVFEVVALLKDFTNIGMAHIYNIRGEESSHIFYRSAKIIP